MAPLSPRSLSGPADGEKSPKPGNAGNADTGAHTDNTHDGAENGANNGTNNGANNGANDADGTGEGTRAGEGTGQETVENEMEFGEFRCFDDESSNASSSLAGEYGGYENLADADDPTDDEKDGEKDGEKDDEQDYFNLSPEEVDRIIACQLQNLDLEYSSVLTAKRAEPKIDDNFNFEAKVDGNVTNKTNNDMVAKAGEEAKKTQLGTQFKTKQESPVRGRGENNFDEGSKPGKSGGGVSSATKTPTSEDSSKEKDEVVEQNAGNAPTIDPANTGKMQEVFGVRGPLKEYTEDEVNIIQSTMGKFQPKAASKFFAEMSDEQLLRMLA